MHEKFIFDFFGFPEKLLKNIRGNLLKNFQFLTVWGEDTTLFLLVTAPDLDPIHLSWDLGLSLFNYSPPSYFSRRRSGRREDL